jgi:iron-regulated transporter 1
MDRAIDEEPRWNADMDEDDRRDSDETIDELESSLSVLSSEGNGGRGTSWEERLKWWKMYALHFLFMWNSRTFEYVSVSHSKALCLYSY